jgi:hypothetical protein
MDQDTQADALKLGARPLEHDSVLKYATRQNHGFEIPMACDPLACTCCGVGKAVMEASGHHSYGHTCLSLAQDRGHRIARIQLERFVAALHGNRILPALGVVNRALQLDRGLTLIGDSRAHAT